jgi:50S ribosomal protein L16 3-hydroxylase
MTRRIKSSTVPGLAELLGARDLRGFFSDYWPDRHALIHGPLGRARALGAQPELENVSKLLGAVGSELLVMPRNIPGAGYGGGVEVRTLAAAAFFASGLTLWVKNIDRHLPYFGALRSRFARDLGVGERDVHPQLWISPKGPATPQHFDAAESFVFQLRGTKLWRIAPNEEIKYPLLDSQLSSTSLRPAKLEVELRPGSFLFLPRGYWHSTEALSESWSVTFFVKSPCWLQILQEYLFRELSTEERWRRPISVAAGSADYRAATALELSTLLAELGGRLQSADASALLEAARRPVEERRPAARRKRRAQKYRREARSAARLVESKNGTLPMVRVKAEDGTRTEIQFSPELLPVVSRLLRRSGPVSLAELEPMIKQIAGDGVSEALYREQYLPKLLDELVEARLLARA